MLHAPGRNTKINKTRLLKSRHLQSRGTIFTVIIFSCPLFSNFSQFESHYTILSSALHHAAKLPYSLHRICPFTPVQVPGYPDFSRTSSSSPVIKSQPRDRNISDILDFFLSNHAIILATWIAGSSCSVQLAFKMRLPRCTAGLLHNGLFIYFYGFEWSRTSLPAENP